jgi:hypothetical protein
MDTSLKTFAQALCEHVGCNAEDYIPTALKHCLYPQPRALHRLYAFLLPATDIRLLQEAGTVTTEDELDDLLLEYRQRLHLHGGFIEKRLRLRVSTGRLEKLFEHVQHRQRF